MARAWQRWHHLGGRVRAVLGDACLVGKGRWPAAAVRWDSNPPSPRSILCGRRLECLMTWHSCIPAMTARARRGPAVAEAVRTQRGPARRRQLGKHGCLLVIRRWPNQPRP
jgi:hypothetical protein